MKNNEVKLIIDGNGSKYYVLKNNSLDLSNKKTQELKSMSTQEAYKNVITVNKKNYYKGSLLHREDGPAIEHLDGQKDWFLNGKLHREDGPAVEYDGNNWCWYNQGKIHREDGPAVKESGDEHFYLKGIVQKTIYENGDILYFKNGELHRLDGPAIEYKDKDEVELNEYWINGKKISAEIFNLEKELRDNLIKSNKIKKNKI